MVLKISVSASDLFRVANTLDVALQAVNSALPTELNNSGHQLYYDIVNEVAEQFPEIPPGAIAAAISSREASGLIPSFVIASRDSMVTYVRWVTLRDEKVCKVCGPRDDVIYRIIDVMDIWPAHPNCRCRLERLDISSAMLAAGADLVPGALADIAQGVLEAFARALR
jgi:hypothetical protein